MKYNTSFLCHPLIYVGKCEELIRTVLLRSALYHWCHTSSNANAHWRMFVRWRYTTVNPQYHSIELGPKLLYTSHKAYVGHKSHYACTWTWVCVPIYLLTFSHILPAGLDLFGVLLR